MTSRQKLLARRLPALLALLAVTLPAAARGPGFSSAVNGQVAAAKRIAPEIGVHIVEVESGEEVYSYKADVRRIPASNTKLATSAAALDRLGPGFFFETEVLVRGVLDGATLRGELAILGAGDPNISGRHYLGDPFGAFRTWGERLKDLGVERVAGDLILVDGLFDRETVHPDWPRDQLTRWYEAPVSALSFNDNCVLVKVSPNGGAGHAAIVETVPDLPIFSVRSTAATTGRSREQWLKFDRLEGSNVLTVAGKIFERNDPVGKWVTVADPVEYFGAALRQALAEEGVTVTGALRPAAALPDAGWRRLTTHRSDLLTTLEVVNKRSQNFYAESVLKTLGARLCGEGSWSAGVRAVTEFLDEAGLDRAGYRLADGSGMSRNNRFSPAQLTRLLRYMHGHRWGELYLRTLPYSGERDLRWERRLASGPYRGNVLAKTGTLSAVSALSGYAKARSGRLYAFSILMNQARTVWQAEAAQDRIVRALIDHG